MERKKSASNEEFKKVFKDNYAELLEILPTKDMLPVLLHNDLITKQEMEEISA